ncbi:aldose epimerase family protein [uncultured Cetobacterium sp.]|uniref:aldose epimerase family protein n=1 Tax=uncultured Cetobacterium sp. TaxID=527638 RepID=UPI002635695E|nr:aldose epimerase family protein [uncultured Cetobacterium sp.]
MELKISIFGKTSDGEDVLLYNFLNEYIDVEILSYGGIIKSLKVPDRYGIFENVVLGYESFREYENDLCHHACITGRVAGRTKDAVLEINEKKYPLSKNNGKNNLHGGENTIHNRNWRACGEVVDNEGILTLETFSPHLEEGFPGNVEFKVIYRIQKNKLVIEYVGYPDRETYLNLTNHAYFNLSGNAKEKILFQEVLINGIGYGKVDNETLPVSVEKEDLFVKMSKYSKLNDIVKSKHSQVEIVGGGIDHPFILSKLDNYDVSLKDEKSGRVLFVKSDQPVAVIYTGNFLEEKYNGICFEMQDYPDIQNFMPTKIKIYNKSKPYQQNTEFLFDIL